ncbi:unnamed protein product [Lactuca saligna]|uniref:Neutral/alkaline non-lysosomal ceramidase N-terminal domain-containing protein n=1 Tax=Lactuca saligna TaxID=75948 RepID=A0AA35Z6L6_LACSI|nr:unnamed protein product [Lactuca saligna]
MGLEHLTSNREMTRQGKCIWKLVGGLLKKPDEEQINFQDPKPILIDTCEMHDPYDWATLCSLPHYQFRFCKSGNLLFSVFQEVFVEFTTMAGRRLRDAVKEVLTSFGEEEEKEEFHVVIAGLTNTYSQYVTTIEEYQIQRYQTMMIQSSGKVSRGQVDNNTFISTNPDVGIRKHKKEGFHLYKSGLWRFLKVFDMLEANAGFLVRATIVFICEILDCCPWFEFADLEVTCL